MSNVSKKNQGIDSGVAVVGFLATFLAGGAVMYGLNHGAGGKLLADSGGDSQSSAPWSDSDSPIPIDSRDPMWGKRDALVTIVQFSDFQCPYCSKVEPVMSQIEQTYGPDKVRIIWKNMPLSFHPNAKPAAEAAAGVMALKGSDAFWKFNHSAFQNQQGLGTDNYVSWAKSAGVDPAKFKAGLEAHKWASKVDEDLKIASAAGVNGTPASFVNGKLISGLVSFDQFKSIIDQEIGKARTKFADGIPKEKLYVAMSKENFQAPKAPSKDEEEVDETAQVWKVPLGKAPSIGADKPLVNVVVFSDFQCPYCSKVEEPLAEVKKQYGDKVRIYWRNYPMPFHSHAEPAIELALEARAEKGEKGFWDAHDKIFASQKNLDDENLDRIGKELGLDPAKVRGAISEHRYKKEIDADLALGATVGVAGTPNLYVNGHKIGGLAPFATFKKLIDPEIAKASLLLAKGVKPAALYGELTKDGKTK